MMLIHMPLRKYLKRNGMIYAGVLIATVAGCWSPFLGFFFFLVGMFAVPVMMFATGAALSLSLWRDTKGKPAPLRVVVVFLIPSSATLAALALVLPLLRTGILLGSESLLWAYGGRYAAIISKVQHGPPAKSPSGWQQEGSITYVVDYGSPRRLAFEPSGFLDNWSGIVWDPTHEVMKAEGFDADTGRFKAPDKVTKLFGGDLLGCSRLGGDWFLCSFT